MGTAVLPEGFHGRGRAIVIGQVRNGRDIGVFISLAEDSRRPGFASLDSALLQSRNDLAFDELLVLGEHIGFDAHDGDRKHLRRGHGLSGWL